MSLSSAAINIDALYGEHHEWLESWLSQRTRCVQRAADLVQDTFCRLLESRRDEPIRDPRAYLSTVARRLLVDDIRRREIERSVTQACALHECGVDMITPERIVQAVQLVEAVTRILDGLPLQARTAFLLRRLEGMEQKDIADHLGISLSTVKRHIQLAYARCYRIAYED